MADLTSKEQVAQEAYERWHAGMPFEHSKRASAWKSGYMSALVDRRTHETSDELTVQFPRAWAPYLQAVILGAIGDMDGDGDCRWHLNELAKFLGRAAEKTNGDVDDTPDHLRKQGYRSGKSP